jgi:hypothetical protein
MNLSLRLKILQVELKRWFNLQICYH